MNTTQIFSEEHLNSYLKKYLSSQIGLCDSQIKECKFILTSDEDIMPEERTEAQRKLEILSYRRFFLNKQLDSLDYYNDDDKEFNPNTLFDGTEYPNS